MNNLGCYFDAATPGTGPIKSLVNATSVEFEKYNSSYNFSLKSKSDLNYNPQPEGNIFSAYPKAEQNRAGVYAIDTDRGELNPTVSTQINVRGPRTFQARLQDQVRPTMKEKSLFAYEGNAGSSIHIAPKSYSNILPSYSDLRDGKKVRTGGATNFGLKSATEYSYIPGAAPSGINGQALQNPDSRLGKVYQRSDRNVDGASTFKGAVPDGSKFQTYNLINKPTTNGLKLNYNIETKQNWSDLLGKYVDGTENRFTETYQIAPLFSNPLNKIWNPDDKGELPSFYADSRAIDYSYQSQQNLDQDYFVSGTNSNAGLLNLEQGIHNPQLEWINAPNNLPGVVYSADSVNNGSNIGYSGKYDVYQQYTNQQRFGINNNTFTTLGDPSAGMVRY
jgi:hypothetical protein